MRWLNSPAWRAGLWVREQDYTSFALVQQLLERDRLAIVRLEVTAEAPNVNRVAYFWDLVWGGGRRCAIRLARDSGLGLRYSVFDTVNNFVGKALLRLCTCLL